MFCPKGPNGQNSHKSAKGSQGSHQRPDPNGQLSATYLNNCNNNPSTGDPTLDRTSMTPCGSATLTPHFDESYDTPPYVRWSQDFHYLINDEEGIRLFQKFLKSEGLEQLSDFYFACEGLKANETEDKEIIQKLVKILYKRFIRNCNAIGLSDRMRSALKQELTTDSATTQSSDSKYDPRHVFDSAQQEVEEQLKGSVYVNFLRSDIYLNYLQLNAFPNSHSGLERPGSSDSKDNGSTNDSSMESSLDDYNSESTQYYDILPTVDEESELQTTESSVNRSTSSAYLRSQQIQNKFQPIPVNPCHNLMSSGSNDTLRRGLNKILIQRSTDSVPPTRVTTEAHPLSPTNSRMNTAYQSYLRSKSMSTPPNPYHVKYATVLPTSARDSELQSMSSHSTNDSMSCVSGQDGADNPAVRTKKQSLAIKHNAKLNSNAINMNSNLQKSFPLPQSQTQKYLSTMNPRVCEAHEPDIFGPELIRKLEQVKERMERKEVVEKEENNFKKQVYEALPPSNKCNPSVRHPSASASDNSGCRPNKTLKEVLKENKLEFCLPEDDDQEILDKHFAQVFSETPNETPTDSIGRCVSPPKHNFKTYNHRMTPPVSGAIGGSFDPIKVAVTVKYSTEQFPYRLTLNGPHITLRKFKQQIPAKRGNWQYYFKRKCDHKELMDISTPYVLEKISDDNQLLPLIDGKIVADLQESN